MGAVYEVRDEAVGETVALKVLTAPVQGRPDALDRFRREVRVARRVTHKNVARTYDLGEHEGRHFLTMEYVEGESLDARLEREGRPPLTEALEIGRQIGEGLAAAHAAGVVHRDLKPANVMVERSGRVVVTDFGIARAIEQETASVKATAIVGTPAYMAPEQVAGEAVDARADLFAFGVVLYELFTGALPFHGDSPMAAAMARLLHPPPDPRTHAPGLPAPLAELVLRCLARAPANRPSSAAAIAAELSACAASATSPTMVLRAPAAGGAPPPLGAAQSLEGRPAGRSTIARGRSIAVLPLRYRGPERTDYLGQALAEQVVDALSTTRGLRVVAASACARFENERDPRRVGDELGVEVIVDGSVQVAADRVRITARLVDVPSGTQMWAERFDGSLDDVLALEDTMSRRIAEALRVELTAIDDGGRQPIEVLDLYFRGRRELRRFHVIGPGSAMDLFEGALALAPGFKLAIAAHAIAAARGWFARSSFRGGSVEGRRIAEASVTRALAEAPDLAETHLAAGVFAAQTGDYARAVQSLLRALAVAPTYADAHEYLGSLLCEAGRADRGIGHLRLAAELDPSMLSCLAGIARHHALRGEWPEHERALAEVAARGGDRTVHKLQIELRAALWRHDGAVAHRAMAALVSTLTIPSTIQGLVLVGRYALGEIELEELVAAGEDLPAAGANPRYQTNADQALAEAHAARGQWDLAIEALQRAAASALIDIEWLDRCPLLEPLRVRPEMAAIREAVRARAHTVWS